MSEESRQESTSVQNGLTCPQTSLWTLEFFHLNTHKSIDKTRFMISETLKAKQRVSSIVEASRYSSLTFIESPNIIVNDQSILVVSSDLKIVAYDTSNPNLIVALISKGKKAMIICCVYLNPNNVKKLMQVLLNTLSKYKHLPFICAGDVNCEHPLWSVKRHTTPSSKLLAEFIINNSLTIFNKPADDSNFTFKRGDCVSWLDLIFGNVDYWGFDLSDEPISDHKMLKVSVKLSDIFSQILINNHAYRKRSLDKNLTWKIVENFTTNYEIDKTFDSLLQLNKQSKRINLNSHTNNSRIRKLRKRIKSLNRNNKQNFSPEINEMIKDMKSREQELRKISKRNFISYIAQNPGDQKLIWSAMNKILKPTNTLTPLLAPNSSKIETLRPFAFKKPQHTYTSSIESNYLTEEEINKIENLRFNKQSGFADNFTLRDWQRLWELHKDKIIEMIKKTFELGYIPQSIKIYGAHLIPKPNGKFRVIRISNFLLRIYDTIIVDRIKAVLDKVIIKRTQFAYQKDLSIFDLHIILSESWDTSKTIICTDINQAFDKVKVECALDELRKHLSNSDIQLIRQFTYGRWLKTRIENDFKYKPDPDGVPQGSKSGPLLFICALNKIIRNVKQKNLQILAYADDLFILTKNNETERAIRFVEAELTKANLTLNREKTKFYSEKEMKGEPFKIVGIYYNLKPSIDNIDTEIENNIRIINMNRQTLTKLPTNIYIKIINAYISSLLNTLPPAFFLECQQYEDIIIKLYLRVQSCLKDITCCPNRLSYWTPRLIYHFVDPVQIWLDQVITAILRTSYRFDRWPILKMFQPLPLFPKKPCMDYFYKHRVSRPELPQVGYKLKDDLIQIIHHKGSSYYKIQNPENVVSNHLLAIYILMTLTKNKPSTYVVPDALVKYKNSQTADHVASILNKNETKMLWLSCSDTKNISKPKPSDKITTVKQNIVTRTDFKNKFKQTLEQFAKNMYLTSNSHTLNFFNFENQVQHRGRIGDHFIRKVLLLINDFLIKCSRRAFSKDKDKNSTHYLTECGSTRHVWENLHFGWTFDGNRKRDEERIRALAEIITILEMKLTKNKNNTDKP
ncbi:uncharacterized protein LOC112539386 isoform X1 [Tetranychus urticae]|uniref:uncharacterized protein LOC112539386 isoform X1 n=1 Tax=Tetranychus urticae TaxID=32264 RepID=UPI000D647D9D|nr:uncharacterized protein LOC112539386 isoform X1 [Tetranychus urticae]